MELLLISAYQSRVLKMNCKPIFFVKNSESTIITERFEFAKGYNSDLHWAYVNLKVREVSQIFSYVSPDGRGKAMCFMKIFENRSPIRIEFPLSAFKEGYYDDDIFDFENVLSSISKTMISQHFLRVTLSHC